MHVDLPVCMMQLQSHMEQQVRYSSGACLSWGSDVFNNHATGHHYTSQRNAATCPSSTPQVNNTEVITTAAIAHLDDLIHGRNACAASNHAHFCALALTAVVAVLAVAVVDKVTQGPLTSMVSLMFRLSK